MIHASEPLNRASPTLTTGFTYPGTDGHQYPPPSSTAFDIHACTAWSRQADKKDAKSERQGGSTLPRQGGVLGCGCRSTLHEAGPRSVAGESARPAMKLQNTYGLLRIFTARKQRVSCDSWTDNDDETTILRRRGSVHVGCSCSLSTRKLVGGQ
ncbi:hypothetical protein NL676_035269 [Syzygium grande]|nr:hypothetical protein NL676_035269 [Syzygium grande]